jgi:hypothetical protein
MAPVSQRVTQSEPEPEASSISAHRSSPGRTVFTEEGNTDGWIATDFTVELWR